MTSDEVLNKAADYLETNGWCQGGFQQDKKRCAVGAINTVVTGYADAFVVNRRERGLSDDSRKYIRIFANTVMTRGTALHPDPVTAVGWWNDKPERTKNDVVRALRKAGKR